MSPIFPTEVTYGDLEGSSNLDSSKLTAQQSITVIKGISQIL